MRTKVLVVALAVAASLAAQAPVHAVCRGMPEEAWVEDSPLIALGRVSAKPPEDPRGIAGFSLEVERYLKGTGPAVLPVSAYGDGSMTVEVGAPENERSKKGTAAFLAENAGKRALVLPVPETTPGAGYRIGCEPAAFGDEDVAKLLATVESALAEPAGDEPWSGRLLLGGLAALAGIALTVIRIRRKA